MARVSIYVPDELKARMDQAGDAINWSEIARPAFQAALAAYEHRKGQTMSTAVERLRASKQEYEQEESTSGEDAGRAWAKDDAEYGELVAISKIDLGAWAEEAAWGAYPHAGPGKQPEYSRIL